MKTLAAFLLLISGFLMRAAEPKDCAGTWVMRLGQRNLLVLTLTLEGQEVRGVMEEPADYTFIGRLFADIKSPARRNPIVRSRFAEGVLHFTVQNASDPKDLDDYKFTVKGDLAELVDDSPETGASLQEPRCFDRAAPGAKAAVDWEPNRAYVAADSDIPNAEMKTIFNEDQRVRQAKDIDWSVVVTSDGERRKRTRELLDTGALHTGRDFEEAAFVFQHGVAPDDCLLAHTLAMVAMSKGRPTAIWIASATLDRYLQRIGKKQVFGTQFSKDDQEKVDQGKWTQEPYDRTLVTDELRSHLGVPPQSLQAERLKALQKQQ